MKRAAWCGVAIGLTLATSAYSDPLYLYGLQPNDIVFKSIGSDELEVTVPSGVSGATSYQSDTGSFLLGMTDFTTGPLSGQIFPADGTESFVYDSRVDLDTLNGVVTWNEVNNDFGGEPILAGTLAIGSSTGDAAFLSDFPAGGRVTITTYFPVDCSLAVLISNGCSAITEVGSFEGGDTTPPVSPPVPEPGSFGLLGIALGILWGAAHPSHFRFCFGSARRSTPTRLPRA